jgi:hypothetical protein
MTAEGYLENIVANQMQSTTVEKSLLDKLFSKEDIAAITEIHTKKRATKEDMQKLLQLLVGMESKLLNFDEDYPYILGRYFVRIRETFSLYEEMCDYYSQIEKYIKNPSTKEIWESNIYILKATCLFYSSNFQWIARSSMSVGDSAFYNALTNKFELSYATPNQGQQEKKGLLGRVFG